MYVPDCIPAEDLSVMVEKSGHGNAIEIGDRVAVLVVDMTCEFVQDRFPNGFSETGEPAVAATARLLEAARERGIRAYFSKALEGDHPLKAGRWMDTSSAGRRNPADDDSMTDLAPGLEPDADDVVFGKYKPSAFFGTQLESMLTYDRIDTLVVTGMTTSGCVRATVVDAFSRNYGVIVPEECVADRSQISHETSLFDMDMKYADVRPLETVLDAI